MDVYAADTQWRVVSRRSGYERVVPLELVPEVNLSSMSDDYTPDEEEGSPEALWRVWVDRLYRGDAWHEDRPGWVHVGWAVASPDSRAGVFEIAPFQAETYGLGDFLDDFAWPEDEGGEPLNWLRLPVRRKRWTREQMDKGGFVHEVTGWMPSALQSCVYLPTLAGAARLYLPSGAT